MEVTRVFDLLPHYAIHFQRDDALCAKVNGSWKYYSTTEYITTVNNISYGLMQLGIKKGDKIASISPGRPEWNFLDMAIIQLGAIHVPIYPTISESDYKYILHHADVKMVFVSGWDILRKIENIISEVPALKDNVYTFRNLRGYRHLNEVIELGAANPSPQYLQDIKDRISPDDVMTMIFTSGTTSAMKGVMLTHRNIISNFKAILPIVPVHAQSKVLSYLPLCHVYERMMTYAWQYLGIPIYYAESLGTIADNMKEIHPTIFTTVPRLLEKFYDRILSTGRKMKGTKKKLFFWADEVAANFDFEQSRRYQRQLKRARKLVLNKWKAALGGKLEAIVSGGAALQPRLARIFWAAEMPVVEGYGLTETSPVIAVSTFFKNGVKFGAVGPVLPGIEVKIADDGEILTRGHCVTPGYYKAEELTKEAIDEEGWFHTGDMGKLEPEGQLKITGRKKEMFKTAFGKYVVPSMIESKLCEDSLIDNIMVVGENKKFAAALIVPNFSASYTYSYPITKDENIVYAGGSSNTTYASTSYDPSKGILKYRIQHNAKIDLEFTFWKKLSVNFAASYFSAMKNMDKMFFDFDALNPNLPAIQHALVSSMGDLPFRGFANYFAEHQAGSVILDLGFSYNILKDLKVSFVVKNLLNNEYTLRPMHIEAPRNFNIQIAYGL